MGILDNLNLSTWDILDAFDLTISMLETLYEEENNATEPDTDILASCLELMHFYRTISREVYTSFLRDA